MVGSPQPKGLNFEFPNLHVPFKSFRPCLLFQASKPSFRKILIISKSPTPNRHPPDHKLIFFRLSIAAMPQKLCLNCRVQLKSSTHKCQACNQSAGKDIFAFAACSTVSCCEGATAHNST